MEPVHMFVTYSAFINDGFSVVLNAHVSLDRPIETIDDVRVIEAKIKAMIHEEAGRDCHVNVLSWVPLGPSKNTES